VKRNRADQTRWTTDVEVVDLVRVLARQMPDQTIAALLNRSGKSTGRGNSWTRGRICSLRHQYDITIYRDGERADRGEVTIDEAAGVLAVSTSTIRRLEEVRRQANMRRSRRPLPDGRQQNLLGLSIT
jgi:hypothetical protein